MAGMNWIDVGIWHQPCPPSPLTIHPSERVSLANGKLTPAPIVFPTVTITVIDPLMNPRIAAGLISEQ
jgi:hypothetical protein